MRFSVTGWGRFERHRAWAVGLVAVLLAWAWLAWANQAWRREAGRRFAHHQEQYWINRGRWLVGLKAAREAIQGPERAAARLRNQTEEATGPRIRVDPGPVGGGRSVLEGLDEAERRLDDTTLFASRADYHARMTAFYEDALASWAPGLPSIPEDLEVDRRVLALQMHRRYAVELKHGEMVEEVALYDAEPPRHLHPPADGQP